MRMAAESLLGSIASFAEVRGLPTPAEAFTGARFLAALTGYLRRPIRPEQAERIVRWRLAHREQSFLRLVRDLVYGLENSPYARLLRHIGCEYGDLERMLGRDGLEASLSELYGQGVYLSVDELKGRQAVTRGSTSFWVDPRTIINPRATVHLVAHTSGSGGLKTPVPFDLRSGRDHAVNRCLVLAARGALDWPTAVWGLPGGAETIIVLRYAAAGARMEAWFAQVDPAASGMHPRYRWSGRLTRWMSRMAGCPLPSPSYVSLQDPLPIAHWMRSVLTRGLTPHLKTFVSPAVRLCQAAEAAGIPLEGAQMTVVGEPITATRVAEIRRAGVTVAPEYGSVEVGTLGEACLAPDAPDDMHLMHDVVALVQAESAGPLRVGALMVTSLLGTAPLMLLNYCLGDRARVVRRECGCPMEGYGWTTHLAEVRSFEKLTGEGMTISDSQIIHVLDEVLPARFGGGPTDYQLAEGETSDGRAALWLRVHPRLGPLDHWSIRETFLSAVGNESGIERVMERLWREAELLTVEREPPVAQENGKIQHLWKRQGVDPLR